MAHQLKITLEGSAPPIWRRVVLPSDLTLLDLHFVIQTAMGWENEHPHDFVIGAQNYRLPDAISTGSALSEIEAVLDEVAPAQTKIRYQYDFGDSWYHEVIVEKIIDDPELATPRCLEGARACPPEQSGGVRGYQDRLASSHDQGRRRTSDALGEELDPEFFDRDAVNRELEVMFPGTPTPTPTSPDPQLTADERRKARNQRKKQLARRGK